jgi:hypothetical protein
MKMSLDSYDSLANLREHVQNMCNSLELIVQDGDSMCKIFLTTFKGSACAWYNNLEPNSIKGFNDLCAKLVAHFITNITAKKNFTELFSVIQ